MPYYLLLVRGPSTEIGLLKTAVEQAIGEVGQGGLEVIVMGDYNGFAAKTASPSLQGNESYINYRDSVVEVNGNIRQVKVRGKIVHLEPRTFDLLALLTSNPGVYVSYESILKNVWHNDSFKYDRYNIRWQIRQLRRVIETGDGKPQVIVTAHKRGYAYMPPAAQPTT